MPRHTNLTKRDGSSYWQARVAAPAEVLRARAAAGITGRREVHKSMKTSDFAEAKRRLRAFLEEMDSEWTRELASLSARACEVQEATSRADVAGRIPTPDELREAVRLTMIRMRDGDEELRMSNRDTPGRSPDVPKLHAQLKRVLGAGTATPANIERAVDRMAQRVGFVLPAGTAARQTAIKLYERMVVDLLRVLEQRNAGDFTGDFADPLLRNSAPADAPNPSSKRAQKQPSVTELLELFLRDRMKGLSREQETQKRSAVRNFVQLFGADRPVSELDRAAMRDFKLHLMDYPVRARKRREFSGLTFPQIVQKNRTLRLPSIKDKTINAELAHMGAFCKWLGAHGYIPDGDLTSGLLISIDQREGARDSYSAEEMQKIFSLPLFRGARSSKRFSEPGSFLIRDSRFWLPLLCAFTGARLGEMVQLETSDVITDAGVDVLVIRSEGETKKSLKTKFSARTVPVHDELKQLGFLDYVAQRRSGSGPRLFPELRPGDDGLRESHPAGKSFRTYLGRNAMPGCGFHRLRHTMIDALRRAGHLNEEISAIVGHQGAGTVTARYGSISSVTLSQRVNMVAAIHYPGLDLSALYVASSRSTSKS